MELLRALMQLQHDKGFVDDEALRLLSQEQNVPLYRLEGLVSFYPHFRRTPPKRLTVRVCRDVCCRMNGGERLRRTIDALAASGEVEVQSASCLGRCDHSPALTCNDVPTEHGSDITLDTLEPSGQSRLGSQTSSFACDPYTVDGERYTTVQSLLAESPDDFGGVCIEKLEESKLRGMGGAGFPTGLKWKLVAGEATRPKYVICNADESEPGTFKDREILAQLPHLVIEGMLLAGLTIGSEKGIVYLRHEYEQEGERLQAAIDDARRSGILGDSVCGTQHKFDIEIFISPGGYILGEETALLEALEDKRGEPRNKPPYPGTAGLWGKPTLINNVESFAFATAIIHHGPRWWQEQGKDEFHGLKFTSISGDVQNPGVYEVPCGTTVRELVELAGGSVGEVQAFLPGGASSKFLGADTLDTPLDFDAMKAAGSMLGTGAVIVMNDQRNLFELASNLVSFFRNESCGKCVPCRLGSDYAVQMLERTIAGEQIPSLESELIELNATMEQTSICGLGQVALAPVISMLERFPREGEAPAEP